MTRRGWEPASYAAILVAALGTAACGDAPLPEDTERVDDATQPIVNGSVDSGDPAVVAMTAFGQAFCTGTLITPTVVLTAAHCLPPNIGEFGINSYDEIEVFFGTSVGSGSFIPVTEGWTHPGWNIDVFEHDIGLVRLASAGPATPIPHATTQMTLGEQGSQIRIVGFGITSEGANNSGTKRQGTTTIDEIFQFVFTTGLSPSVTCSGDSGGPTFMDRGAGEQVIGVHSRSDCVSGAVDTRVDDYQNDINNFLGVSPMEPQCFEDGQCATGCGSPDPDCPCNADGFCTEACTDQAADPDCVPSCEADGTCNPACLENEDPDCDTVDPPPGESSETWLAGDSDDKDYDGTLVSSCAFQPAALRAGAPQHGPWQSQGHPRDGSRGFVWLLLGAAVMLRRRR